MQTDKTSASRRPKTLAPKRAPTGGAGASPPPKPADAPVGLGHLDHVLGYLLRRAQVAVFNDFRRMFDEFGIRPTQYAVLSIISEMPGLKQGDVSAALGIKRTNFVAVLDELERRGLARRQAVADDRRSRALHLTEEGAALMGQLRKRNSAHEARLAALLPPGQAAILVGLLRDLTAAIGRDSSEA
ncbi:MAG: MarR family transcriptional regulator [Hyphomicrobiales bacterium]|nr:MarR family transcriptional regulator [Hyphomicrobiales bacterium]